MKPAVLTDMDPINMSCLLPIMNESGVTARANCTVTEILDDGVAFINEQGEKEVISADLVVLAFGYKAYNPLEKIANELCEDVQVVGGAIKAGNALPAVKEGYEADLHLHTEQPLPGIRFPRLQALRHDKQYQFFCPHHSADAGVTLPVHQP